eukprot:TRINITY_DN3707_c0_g1_i4.p1 TRINITY_DN3707_c0_g1~~TRINITY_DN3707_c0_g1_i4.p1  ORF type:complete len:541 (+),score=67.91 TRINITY_DN3707_c0_g1_i4:218-1840(+)
MSGRSEVKVTIEEPRAVKSSVDQSPDDVSLLEVSPDVDRYVTMVKNSTPSQRPNFERRFFLKLKEETTTDKYQISGKWFAEYLQYVAGARKKLPSQITNSDLKLISEKPMLINSKLWSFLSKLYGFDIELPENKGLTGRKTPGNNRSRLSTSRQGSIIGRSSLSPNVFKDAKSPKGTKEFIIIPQSVSTKTPGSLSNSQDPLISKKNSNLERLGLQRGRFFEVKPVGILNTHNYCFMNAVMQSLINIPELSQYFLQQGYRQLQGYNASSYQTCHVMSTAIETYITCTKLYCNPKELKQYFSTDFDPNQQQDAHEYLIRLREKIRDEINPIIRFPEGFRDVETYWSFVSSKYTSVMDAIFCGQQTSTFRCNACLKGNNVFETFFELSLPIPLRRDLTLEECLEEYVMDEIIEEYTCESCKKSRGAVKQTTLNVLPPVLLLVLKRFQVKGRSKDKIRDFVRYPTNLDFSRYLKQTTQSGMSTQYKLDSIIAHSGSIDHGHYVCYALRDSEWYLFDDEKASKVDTDTMLSAEAYILCFRRIDL